MLSDGDWGLPRQFDGRADLQKPPLYYWMVAGFGWLRGGQVDAWAVRLPAALAATGIVWCLWISLRRSGRPAAAIVAALVLASAIHFTWSARTGRIDMPLSLTSTVAILGFFHARSRPNARAAFLANGLSYLALVGGILLKGPIGFVLPAAVIGMHAILEGDWRPRRWGGLVQRLGLWWGLPLVALLTVPWFLWANTVTNGEFFRVFFWHHNLERGLGGSADLEQHPWWFYLPRFAFDFLPWTPLLGVAVWQLLRRGWWQDDPLARLGLVWFTAMILLLSCAQFKRADYLVPAFPGAALLLGCVTDRWYAETSRRRLVLGAFAATVMGCVVGWWVYVDVVLPRNEPGREQQRFAAEIRRHVPAPGRVLVFWAEPHALVFHLGRPVRILIEWDRLDAELAAGPAYVVMPPEIAARSGEFLRKHALDEVVRNTDLSGGKHEKPLVLLRARALTSPTGTDHARTATAAAADGSTSQPDPAWPQ